MGFFFVGNRVVIRDDFIDIENLFGICFFSLILILDFVGVFLSFIVGVLDVFFKIIITSIRMILFVKNFFIEICLVFLVLDDW